MAFFNPLFDAPNPEGASQEQSTSSLINDVLGVCPKCKNPFGFGTTVSDHVYYCDSCRVSQPKPE